MSEPDEQNCKSNKKRDPWINAEEFRDVPTSDTYGADISYYDTVLWISDSLLPADGETVNIEDSKETEAEVSIRQRCDKGELVAWGRKNSNGNFDDSFSEIPATDWKGLVIDVTKGQPADDCLQHGGRCYGEASWVDAGDPFRLKVAWTTLFFRKSDVLKYWPATQPLKRGEPSSRALDRNRARSSQRKIREALDSFVQGNPTATMRQADSFAVSIGAPRETVREKVRKARSKKGGSIKPGRPKKADCTISRNAQK